MKNNDKSNLNDKDLENISGGDIGNKKKFDKEKLCNIPNVPAMTSAMTYGIISPMVANPISWEIYRRRMEEKTKKQDEKEGAEPLLPETPDKEDK